MEENLRVDIGAINRLDKDNNAVRMIRNIQENPMRYKFMRNNREWLIHNLALILGGKNYLSRAGKELDFLKSIYQKAVNAEAIENRLKKEEERIA